MRQRCMGSPYNSSPKNILEKFYEEPLDGFFILCRERGMWLCTHVACTFQEELNARSPKSPCSKKGPRCPYRKIKFY